MFSGTYHHNIDSKGRIIIPSRFREELGTGFVLTKGLDHCLFLFPMSEWNEFRSKLKAVPLTSREGRAFTRYFFANAVNVRWTNRGGSISRRFYGSMPASTRRSFLSVLDRRIEIWSRAEWEKYSMSPELDSELIAEKMEGLGI